MSQEIQAPQPAQAAPRPFTAVKAFADSVLAMLDERIKTADRGTHLFNDYFGDKPEAIVAAKAQASELREVRTQVRMLGDRALVDLMKFKQAIPAPEGAQLPPLPPHPDARVFTWTSRELAAIKRYGEECARAALAAPAPQAPAWQPIETAPKDGSRLILWWAGATRVGRCAGVGASRDGGDWWQCPSLECAPTGRPTHWMPLPAAPQTKDQS